MEKSAFTRLYDPLAQRGISLTELMVSASIITILVGLSLPVINTGSTNEAEQVMQDLESFIRVAQHEAIIRQAPVTLCPRGTGVTCGQHWRDGVQLVLQQELLAVLSWPELSGNLTWRSFGSSSQITIDATGALLYQNGSFSWCPPAALQHAQQPAHQLVINSAGRLRHTQIYSADQPLPC